MCVFYVVKLRILHMYVCMYVCACIYTFVHAYLCCLCSLKVIFAAYGNSIISMTIRGTSPVTLYSSSSLPNGEEMCVWSVYMFRYVCRFRGDDFPFHKMH